MTVAHLLLRGEGATAMLLISLPLLPTLLAGLALRLALRPTR